MINGRSITIDDSTKTVDLQYPNATMRYDLSQHLAVYHHLVSEVYKNPDMSAALCVRLCELQDMPRTHLEAVAAAKRLEQLEHHEATTVGLWATDRPELFKDHPHHGLLFEIQSLPNAHGLAPADKKTPTTKQNV